MQVPQAPAEMQWLQAIAEPDRVLTWSLSDWERVVRMSRRLRLLARLAESVDRADIEATLPAQVQRHLRAERQRSRARVRALTWTMDQVGLALCDLPAPRVLLKGAAYVAQSLPVAPGRLPSDLDILVPRTAITDAQQRLFAHDWKEVDLDSHDQNYYRAWSHEVPPMHNPRFELELDLHHGILPPVARTTVDPDLLLSRLMPSGLPGWQVFCPVDQVLHSAAHLFLDSELRGRIRDLVDLDGLLRHFSRSPGFWGDLGDRAAQLGLVEVAALGVHFTTRWLGTPVPKATAARLQRHGLAAQRRAWLLPLLGAVLHPIEPDATEPMSQRLSALALLARYHWHRLPLQHLIPHLLHKSGRRHVRELEGDDEA